MLILTLVGLIKITFEETGYAAIPIVLVLSLLGSLINIPLYKVKSTIPLIHEEFIRWFGVTYRVPRVSYKETYTTVAVNVGGAVIPSAMCFYLLAISSSSIFLSSLLGVFIITLFTYLIARPIQGVGIVMPTFITPIATAIVAFVLSSDQPVVIAYVAGTLGTLIGADLLNLGKIPKLGAPVASIGGAGTFDGVFLTGIIAVLLATI
jgi:uncharacterized membrane protein